MRRLIALALVLALLGAMSAAPALAKKKKKAKPPITFEASGAFAIGHPVSIFEASITGTELTNTCAIPLSQGTDGYVVELSEEISQVPATVAVSGGDATGLYDLDLYFFNADCAPVGMSSTAEPNEFGAFGAGTKYVLVSAFLGANITFDLVATEVK